MHLCANLLLSDMIPAGIKMRRNFSFWPGEKSWLNRAYRALIDRWLPGDTGLPIISLISRRVFDRKKWVA